jgi:hypothetical protein
MWFNGAVVERVVCVQEVVSSNPIIDNLCKIAEKNVQSNPLDESLVGCACLLDNFFFLFHLLDFFPIYILPSASLC